MGIATIQNIFLGEVITKFTLPQQFVDDLNKVYDESKILPEWNIELAGKIKEEKLINPALNEAMRGTFLMCFE